MCTLGDNITSMQTHSHNQAARLKPRIKPAVWESWAAHNASRYYIGNAWEHYRCHKVYISDSKYLRSITSADALIKVADNLVDTISGLMPRNSVTVDAVEQLMDIFKIQAKKATCKAQTQRMLGKQVQAQRVEQQQMAAEQQASPQHSPMSLPNIEVDEYPDLNLVTLQGTPIIS
jgi:hypothetical protein